MRRTTLAVTGISLALAAGCGSGGSSSLSSNPVTAIQAAADKTSSATSDKITLTSTTQLGGQTVDVTGDGAFSTDGPKGAISISFSSGSTAQKIEERVIGDDLYLQLPTTPDFYKVKVSDVVGTSLASSTSPSAGLQILKGVTGGVKKVGTETIRGTKTTHYTGTLDPRLALAKLSGPTQALLQSQLKNLTSVPYDAYLDDQGRIRRFVEHLMLTTGGKTATSTTTIDLYDFGTAVDVTAPAASMVKDGAPLVAALKSASGQATG